MKNGEKFDQDVLVQSDYRKIKAQTLDQFHFSRVAKKMMVGSSYSDSSRTSEIYSGHVISSMLSGMGLHSRLYKTEAEISYWRRSQKTDYILDVGSDDDTVRLAVEVKRIYPYPKVEIDYNYVAKILKKACSGAVESNKSVSDCDRWSTQVLHILTVSRDVPSMVESWMKSQSSKDLGFSGVFVTVLSGTTDFIF